MNSKPLITISIISALTGAYWYGIHKNNVSELEVSAEIAALQGEIKSLKELINQQDKNQSVVQRSQASELSGSALRTAKSSQNGTAIDPSMDASKDTEQYLAEQQALLAEEKIQIEARAKQLNQELLSQKKDQEWSSQTEATLGKNFTDKSVEGASLLETDCRSTYCRIVIENKEGSGFNPREVLGEQFTDSEGFYNSTTDDQGNKIVELFVSRNGFNLPQLDQHI